MLRLTNIWSAPNLRSGEKVWVQLNYKDHKSGDQIVSKWSPGCGPVLAEGKLLQAGIAYDWGSSARIEVTTPDGAQICATTVEDEFPRKFNVYVERQV